MFKSEARRRWRTWAIRFLKLRRQLKSCALSDIADSMRSLILEQVTNGLAMHMAALFLVNGGKGRQEIAAVSYCSRGFGNDAGNSKPSRRARSAQPPGKSQRNELDG